VRLDDSLVAYNQSDDGNALRWCADKVMKNTAVHLALANSELFAGQRFAVIAEPKEGFFPDDLARFQPESLGSLTKPHTSDSLAF
jgi:hypothetical protein